MYLPAVCCTGLGVALCLPQLSSAAVQGLPPDQFGSGLGRQPGRSATSAARFGVALVVAFTTGATTAVRTGRLPRVWWLLAVSGITLSILA